jgi:3-oxoacyl-[acyl-carrier protein] reductase
MPIPIDLTGRVALVTGGSRGIGAATVRAFVGAGARVMFNYQAAKGPAEALVAELGERNCAAVACDLSGLDSAADLVKATSQRFDRLDILVANHGIWPPADCPVEEMTDSQWRKTVEVNLDSVFSLIRHAVAEMKGQTRVGRASGHIVLISSTAGQRGEAFHVDYAATKGAIISMVKGLSTELARDQIYVNCVAPGWVTTDMSEPALTNPVTRDAIFATIPLRRVGTPEEIAMPILFLCTPYAEFITGEVLNVNGGAVLVG